MSESEPTTLEQLAGRSCRHETLVLAPEAVARLAVLLPGWTVEGSTLARQFAFAGWGETMGFVNALAWVAHREDHHPELEVGYNRCRVAYSTHAAGGLTLNDFICAAKIDQLAG